MVPGCARTGTPLLSKQSQRQFLTLTVYNLKRQSRQKPRARYNVDDKPVDYFCIYLSCKL